MQRRPLSAAVLLLAAALATLTPYTSLAQEEDPPDNGLSLSPYWPSAVSRWEPQITHYAQERQLDPDLIAAVIWKESQGRPTARSVVGAVGLMQLMPRPNRPSPEELEDPWINLFWGARALAHTIRDGNGDIYYALAAYNGGWGQIHLNVTRRYAASVMDEYARAVAVRHGLPSDGTWFAIFAIEGASSSDTITLIGPQRPVARYTDRPYVQASVPAAPVGLLPHATAITFVDARGIECRVNVWLMSEDGVPLVIAEAPVVSPSEPMMASQSTPGSGSMMPNWQGGNYTRIGTQTSQ